MIAWLNIHAGYHIQNFDGVYICTAYHEPDEYTLRQIHILYRGFKKKHFGRIAPRFFANHFNRKNRRHTKRKLHNQEWDDIPSGNYKVYREYIAWHVD